jgi:hypothetical protein
VLRTILQAMIPVAMLAGGCHRSYEIMGDVFVTPSAVRRAQLPAVLCVGTGGDLKTTFVHGHPGGALFCAEPKVAEVFRLAEWIYYFSLPRQAHVYAWLVPVPAAAGRCAGEGGTVSIDDDALYPIMLSSMRSEHTGGEAYRYGRWPCGENPSTMTPMTFAVTFDPNAKTWEEADSGHWIERRVLRLE